jgi:NitT/TauT family transport system substrate-binding protein
VTTVTEYSGQSTTSAPQGYAAQAEGIYAKYNLKVKTVTISGATSAEVQALAADKSGLSFTGGDIADEMLVADKSTDATPLVAVAADETLNPVALFFLKSSGITKPSDLIGKTIGVPSGSTSGEYLDVFLQKEGIPLNKVKIQNVSFATQAAALISKKVDANAEFVRGGGSLAILGKAHGEQIGSFAFGSYGIAAPLSATLVQKSLITQHPDVAKDIALADAAANQFCVTNPEKCMKDYVAANPGVNYDNALAEWETNIAQGSTWNAATVAKQTPAQFGYFDAGLVAKTVPELETLFAMKLKFDPTTLYTNQFMEAPGT